MSLRASPAGPGLLEREVPGDSGQADSGSAGSKPGRPDTHRGSISYVPALDGIRAFAVAAVIIYHLNNSWLPGGLLGVDVFFVLSGYLITSLLISELDRTGEISLKGFWGRRARRLLPALVITLLGTALYSWLWAPIDRLATIRGDALSTLFYVANWRFILTNQNYFIHFGPPSPLLHTWSLAVEEQFYIVWPLITLGVFAAVVSLWSYRSRHKRALPVVSEENAKQGRFMGFWRDYDELEAIPEVAAEEWVSEEDFEEAAASIPLAPWEREGARELPYLEGYGTGVVPKYLELRSTRNGVSGHLPRSLGGPLPSDPGNGGVSVAGGASPSAVALTDEEMSLEIRRRILNSGRKWFALLAAVLAVSSTVWMAVLYSPTANLSRLYYGTDTHAQVILIGALLALFRPSHHWLQSRAAKAVIPILPYLGVVAVVVLWITLTGESSLLYRGGFALVGISTSAVLIGVLTRPESAVSRFLSHKALRYVGRISYGLYLYHWPAIVFLNPGQTHLNGLPLDALRLSVTIVAAVLSFHFVEQPIRHMSLPKFKTLAVVPATAIATIAAVIASTAAPALQIHIPKPSGSNAIAPPSPTGAAAKVLIEGDSLAWSLGVELAVSQIESQYNLNVVDDATIGCGIAPPPNLQVILNGNPDGLIPQCATWAQTWQNDVNTVRPVIVGILLGRWEITDKYLNGTLTHIGDPSYDNYLQGQLKQAITIASSGGAKVVLMTMPYLETPDPTTGVAYPELQMQRVDEWNAIVRKVAAGFPGVASVYDLNKQVDPGGTFVSTMQGTQIRSSDGVHFPANFIQTQDGRKIPDSASIAAAAIVAPPVLTYIAQLARQAGSNSSSSGQSAIAETSPNQSLSTTTSTIIGESQGESTTTSTIPGESPGTSGATTSSVP